MTPSSADSPVAREALQAWMHKVLQRKGMFAADAEFVVHRLLEAEHRGRSEHGVVLLADIVSAMDLGDIDPRARTLSVLDLPAAAILDGSTGAGQVGATKAMQIALQKAQSAGIGLVVVKNSQPCGDVRLYAELAARAGCLGFCTTNSGKATVPVGESPVFGTHPQAWAVPAGERVLVSQQSPTDPLATEAIIGGLLSLVLTAGLTASRMPSQKKKATPYGAGAEHCCVAISTAALEDAATATAVAEETWQRLSQGNSAWESVTVTALPEQITLPQAGWAAVQEIAQSTRIAWS
jgi:hypothetical protein